MKAQNNLREKSLKQEKLLNMWVAQPIGLTPLEKAVRINRFLNYEGLVEASIRGMQQEPVWFFDLSFYLSYLIRHFYPQVVSLDNLRTLYLKYNKALIYTSYLPKSKDVSEELKKLYWKEYIKLSDMFLSEVEITYKERG